MDWNLICIFLAVAESGTLAAAADRLGLSQPTLGRHIDALEAETGLTLFSLGRHGIQLTEAGLSLVDEARTMRAEADRFALKAADRSQAVSGPVRITASEVVATYILPPLIAEFCDDEPEIEIELVPSNSVENLLSHDADIAVRMFRPTQNDVITRKCGEMGMGVYAHRRYLERHGEPTDIDALFRHRAWSAWIARRCFSTAWPASASASSPTSWRRRTPPYGVCSWISTYPPCRSDSPRTASCARASRFAAPWIFFTGK